MVAAQYACSPEPFVTRAAEDTDTSPKRLINSHFFPPLVIYSNSASSMDPSARFGSSFSHAPFQFSIGAASSSKESSTTPDGHRAGPTVEDKKRKIVVSSVHRAQMLVAKVSSEHVTRVGGRRSDVMDR